VHGSVAADLAPLVGHGRRGLVQRLVEPQAERLPGDRVRLAVAVPPDGLIVPVVKDADRLGFTDLVRAIADLTERARSKHLVPDDVKGGTFTLNNTGALGSVAGQSIINQPQAAILSTEAIRRRPAVVGNTIAIRPLMNLTMSFDHRIIDGLAAARFLDEVQSGIEEWTPNRIRL